ncbi:MAG: polysaccharide deacetylase family protein [Candidatus Aenigmatarchaeota archaeon]
MSVLVVGEKSAGLKSTRWNLKAVSTSREIRDNLADIDFIAFLENESFGIPIGSLMKDLKVGYTSLSAIDPKDPEWKKKQRVCMDIFANCSGKVGFRSKPINRPAEGKTFSLVFDVEQVGGIIYGLPNILKLLERLNIPATFFITNIMSTVFSDLLSSLKSGGHEIGIHGICHENLKDDPEVTKKIRRMLNLSKGITGANLMGRMDSDTVDALAHCGIKYFVHPVKNTQPMFSVSSGPVLINTRHGPIWMVPVSVETYGKRWESVKKQIDLTIKTGSKNITVLLHPFADGSSERLIQLEKMIHYLSNAGYRPARTSDVISPAYRPETEIMFNLFHENDTRKLVGKTKFFHYALKRKKAIERYHSLVRKNKRPAIIL